ncbi:MAG: HD domain-containing protein [Dehalococcoidia bacterium]|nr:HD domain-containing protein [Dehalococcoidia bacterium]
MQPPAELLDALAAPSAFAALTALDESGRLTALIPELEVGRGFVQPELHHYTVLEHNLRAVEALDAATGAGETARELRDSLHWIDVDASLDRELDGLPLMSLLRLATLLHDVAKPHTATMVDGALRFPRHGPEGADMMRDRLALLRFGDDAIEFVAKMIRYHLRPGELVRTWPPTDRAVRKFVSDLDGHVLPLMLVNLSDGWATRGPGYTRENFRRHVGFLNYVLARSWAVSDEGEPPLITGEDLIRELDLESGRLLGAVLTSVRRAQAAGAVSTEAEAMELARETLATLRGAAT